jgi:hypothetical protein
MRHLAAAAALLTLACSAAPRGAGPGDPMTLREDEIAGSDARNAYELVEQLRPRWLRERPLRSLRLETVILVYRDGVRFGTIETLRNIPVETVRHMRVLDAAEAGQLPGLGSQHVERVIMITSLRPG